MRIGLGLPQLGEHVTADSFKAFCESAERVGFGSLWAQEHLFYPLDPAIGHASAPARSIPEPYKSVLSPTEAMAFAAAWTTSLSIGSSVLVGGYHRPVEIAQRLATLDVMSKGRLIAGFSVGWSEEEHAHMDVNPRARGRRMGELIEAVVACWGPDPVTFEGEFFSIPPSIVRPKPLQSPHPPLLSGMWSGPGLARTVALFDIWNPSLVRGSAANLAAEFAGLNERRSAGQNPLRLFLRTFPQFPAQPVRSDGIAALINDVESAIAVDAEELIIDCNFWDVVDSPSAWAKVPELLRELVEIAAR